MQVLEDWQAMIAHNLANSSTTGYQKATFKVEGRAAGAVSRTSGTEQAQTMLPTGKAFRSFQPGEIRVTDNPYDFAIHGEGFFALQGEDGQILYTRDGEFHRNSEGVLVNKLGYPVLSEGGPIEIRSEEGPVTLSLDGTLSQNGQSIDNLGIYRFNDPDQLHRGNGSYFIDPDNAAGRELMENPSVRQNQLEMSTVAPLSEMVSMIQVSRAYELTQKMMEEDEDRVRQAVQTFTV